MLGSPGPTRRPKMGGIQSREELVRAGATPDEIIERTFEYTRAAFSPAALARNPRAADSLKAALRRNFPANYSELVKAFSDAIPSLLELGQVRCPALIVVGEDDARTPPDMSVEIAKAIDGAYLKVLRECGHFYAYEQPEACARTIIEFDRFVHAQSLEER
jgi:pimeloyl-ACP methyl ester carboxylesterase